MKHPAVEYITERRKALGYTQKDMASVMEVSRAYISLIEIGKKPLTQNMICKYNRFLTDKEHHEWETLLGMKISNRNQEKYQKFITLLTEFFDELPEHAQDMALIKIKTFMEDRKRK